MAVVLLVLVARLARSEGYHPGKDATMVLGFILIAAYLVGSWMPRLGTPRITGYLLTGVLFGPHLLELMGLSPQFALIDKTAIKELELFKHVALGLIAFTAGGELRLTKIKEPWQAFTWVTLGQAGTVFLGVTVVKDVLVVVVFAATLIICRSLVFPQLGAAFDPHFAADIVWEVLGSLVLGTLLGAMLVFYVRYVRTDFPIVVLSRRCGHEPYAQKRCALTKKWTQMLAA